MFAGCTDQQTSADTNKLWNEKTVTFAMAYALIVVIPHSTIGTGLIVVIRGCCTPCDKSCSLQDGARHRNFLSEQKQLRFPYAYKRRATGFGEDHRIWQFATQGAGTPILFQIRTDPAQAGGRNVTIVVFQTQISCSLDQIWHKIASRVSQETTSRSLNQI